MNTTERAASKKVLQEWSNVAKITFTEVFFYSPDADLVELTYFNTNSNVLGADTKHLNTHGTSVSGDDIDLSTIDAKARVSGNNGFHWIATQSFHDMKGELRYTDKGSSCLVQGDVTGDGKADFEILVKVGTLGAGDFLL
jgi:hypothetical protein